MTTQTYKVDTLNPDKPRIIYYNPSIITQEQCNQAFKENPGNIRHIPVQFITQEMYTKAFELDVYIF